LGLETENLKLETRRIKVKEAISKIDPSGFTLNDKLVYITRVAHVVKGGNRMRSVL
jgi:ribosomal protein S5